LGGAAAADRLGQARAKQIGAVAFVGFIAHMVINIINAEKC